VCVEQQSAAMNETRHARRIRVTSVFSSNKFKSIGTQKSKCCSKCTPSSGRTSLISTSKLELARFDAIYIVGQTQSRREAMTDHEATKTAVVAAVRHPLPSSDDASMPAAASTVSKSPPPQPTIATMSREEMDLLKTALAILVVKKRLCQEAGIVVPTKNKQPRLLDSCCEDDDDGHRRNSGQSVRNALQQCTGEAVLCTMKEKSVVLAEKENAKVWNRVNFFGTMETEANNSSIDDPLSTIPLTQLPNVSLIAHNDALQWESHVQHVLQLLWRQPRGFSGMGSQRFDSLARHVACQLELAMVNPSLSTAISGGAISDWLCSQLLAFSVSAITTVASGSNGATAQDRAWWATIWHSIVHSKPAAVSELLVPVLLDLLLLCEPHAIATTTATTAEHASVENRHSANTDTVVIGLEPMLILSLLEAALPYAPWHIWSRVEFTLLPSPPPPPSPTYYGNLNDDPRSAATASLTDHAPSLLPTHNTAWCSTNDLASGLQQMFRQQQAASLRPPAAVKPSPSPPLHEHNSPLASFGLVSQGDFFLLGHGLASLSEHVIATMTRASAPPAPRFVAPSRSVGPRPRGGWPHWSGFTPP
jgi:hypothetical protein